MTDFWKNKKVIAYIALAHHTRFISPVVEMLADQGAKIQYVVGQAERSQKITAIKLGLNYAHVFDFVSDKDRHDVQENYLRLRDAFANNLKSSFLFGCSPVTVIDKTIYATAVEYVGFRNLLKKEKPDICFALHELNRWGKMFAFWSKKLNIPVITFQEGMYYGLNFGLTGHVQNSTLSLVWGERVKRKLTDFEAPGDKIIPVGNTHLSNEIECQKKNQIRKKKRKQYNCTNALTILLLFSGEIPLIDKLSPLFNAIAHTPDVHLFIKFHPITNHAQFDQWVTTIPDSKNNTRIKAFHDDENTYNLISLSDVCVLVQPSTTGLEALAFGKPLIYLDSVTKQKCPSPFTEFNVAIKMTPDELGTAIFKNTDFSKLIKQEDVKNYFKSELSNTTDAVNAVTRISKKIITANQSSSPVPIQTTLEENKDWSIILLLSHDPDETLSQLEAIALNSEGSGTFEVILLEPPDLSEGSLKILNSLEGNVKRLVAQAKVSLPEMMNKASKMACGTSLLFLDEHLLPLPKWLYYLQKGIKEYGNTRILGARILDKKNSLLHAGIVLDENNSPVSAYKYLPGDFPSAMKERPFKMLDHFICINKKVFHDMGGFWQTAGKFMFMDICLRADTHRKDINGSIYIPDACLRSLHEPASRFEQEASICFFGKWHGKLWENQEALYATDNITNEAIVTARISQSMEAADFIG